MSRIFVKMAPEVCPTFLFDRCNNLNLYILDVGAEFGSSGRNETKQNKKKTKSKTKKEMKAKEL